MHCFINLPAQRSCNQDTAKHPFQVQLSAGLVGVSFGVRQQSSPAAATTQKMSVSTDESLGGMVRNELFSSMEACY